MVTCNSRQLVVAAAGNLEASQRRGDICWATFRSASFPPGRPWWGPDHQGHTGPVTQASSSPCCRRARSIFCGGLEDFSIDVGLTYLDNEPIEGMRSEAIYMERYCLLVRADHDLAEQGVRDLGGGLQAAALPAHAEHAEPAHHRPCFPQRPTPQPTPRLETNSVIKICTRMCT